MNKWIDFVHKQQEKQDGIQIIKRRVSLSKLEGVSEDLVETVKKAIELTSVDFGVIYGVRSLAEQEKLFKSGRSQTMKSKHLIQDDGFAHAVDLMAYQDGSPC